MSVGYFVPIATVDAFTGTVSVNDCVAPFRIHGFNRRRCHVDVTVGDFISARRTLVEEIGVSRVLFRSYAFRTSVFVVMFGRHYIASYVNDVGQFPWSRVMFVSLPATAFRLRHVAHSSFTIASMCNVSGRAVQVNVCGLAGATNHFAVDVAGNRGRLFISLVTGIGSIDRFVTWSGAEVAWSHI